MTIQRRARCACLTLFFSPILFALCSHAQAETYSKLKAAKPSGRTFYSGNTVCDPDMVLKSSIYDGNWVRRWGTPLISGLGAPATPCGKNRASMLLRTAANNAVLVNWKKGTPGSIKRNADVSFMIPDFTNFNHMLVAPAYNASDIGRMGIALWRDRMFVQVNPSNDRGCKVSPSSTETNLLPLNGVRLSFKLERSKWYRLNSQLKQVPSGLEFKGILTDLQTMQTIGSIVQTTPWACYPRWLDGPNVTWAIGVMDSPRTTVSTTVYIDDFVGRPITAPPGAGVTP